MRVTMSIMNILFSKITALKLVKSKQRLSFSRPITQQLNLKSGTANELHKPTTLEGVIFRVRIRV